jgi:Zn-dependent M16 (insulinase) family peptidase
MWSGLSSLTDAGYTAALAAPWTHGNDPLPYLHINPWLDKLRADLAADPQFLQRKVRTLFLENTHQVPARFLAFAVADGSQVFLVMHGDNSYSASEAKLESTLISRVRFLTLQEADDCQEEQRVQAAGELQQLAALKERLQAHQNQPPGKRSRTGASLTARV